jgi:hypothetical protein
MALARRRRMTGCGLTTTRPRHPVMLLLVA